MTKVTEPFISSGGEEQEAHWHCDVFVCYAITTLEKEQTPSSLNCLTKRYWKIPKQQRVFC